MISLNINTPTSDQNEIFLRYILPTLIAALVSAIGILVQYKVGKESNLTLERNILQMKSLESKIQFYRPFRILLNNYKLFFDNNQNFEFDSTKRLDAYYSLSLNNLKEFNLKILKYFDDSFENIYPENRELDRWIFQFYNYIVDIENVIDDDPESWKLLNKYKKTDIIELIMNIINKIDDITYET